MPAPAPPARSTALPRTLLLLAAGLLAACETPPSDPSAAPRDDGVVAIGTVQGAGPASPLLDETVAVEGVVTGNFARGLGGWFVQDAGDGDEATSDAVFVVADEPAQLRTGDRVRVRGRVVEHGERTRGTLTTLQAEAIEVVGRGEVAPVVLAAAPDDWERYEGMRVRIDAPLTIGGQHELSRRGVLHAAFDGRLFTPTELAPPGPEAERIAAGNARRRLLLDDAMAREDPREVWYLEGRPPPRSGSLVTGVEGIVDQRWGDVRLQLTAAPRIEPAPRPAPPTVAGTVRLAAFNLQNLFNGDGRGGGFPTERGARTPAQLEAQLGRLVATIRALDPHVAALMELENDGYGPDSSIAQLVDALNAGGDDWRFVDSGQGPGDDAIRVGLVYRASRLRPVGAPAMLEDGPFGARSRVPLAQGFVPVAAGRDAGPAFVVVANHFKSKGCREAEGADRDQGDGQACWNATRVESARRLLAWLERDPTRTGSDLVAIVGDMNAYAEEDPLRLLRRHGWRDAMDVASVEGAYSYVFDGQAGRLDHALLSPALAARLAGAATWSSNADEPNVGHRAANSGDPVGNPWRSSDHDPLLVGLDL
ncbi:ExeM/NucH family extracellular endonuclease [Luteimonas viscosa]|uniref:ExeM/NucH family extracellular endonuclease n=1 Tax=Luteimonas viscosa TaxID=1132694 RepID=A0A5D4XRG5_9GAMM|nr:ExeM/NucH family extracellular endonuclease [Luteimonas viscosa]TYT26555.1 ExeM/NucH family extracellular endonuclease [Luteimonas viscosa]